jgi:dTDP-4-amino-4,6-dideoxygalactose transaminase
MIYYPVPLHLQHVHKDLGYREGSFSASETASRQVLSLPMFPELAQEDQQKVIAELLRVAEPVSV